MKSLVCMLFCAISLGLSAQDTTRTSYIGILTLTPFYQTDSNWTDADGDVIGAHFMRLQEMAKSGIIELAGRVNLPSDHPDMFGLVIILPTTKEEAEKIMFEDPAVKANIMQAKVLPFNIAVQKK
jgi:uncharacterized protein